MLLKWLDDVVDGGGKAIAGVAVWRRRNGGRLRMGNGKGRRQRKATRIAEGYERGPLGSEFFFAGGVRRWPDAPPNAKYPLAHLKPEHVEPESVRMMSEVLKALRPHPEARQAVRDRFAELFRKEP